MLVPVNVSPAGLVDQLPDFVGYLAPNLQNKCGCVVAHTVMSVKDVWENLVSLPQVAVETVSDVSPEEPLPVSLEDSPASQQQKVRLGALLVEHREIFSTSKRLTDVHL